MALPRIRVHGPELITRAERVGLARTLGQTEQSIDLSEPAHVSGWKAIGTDGTLQGLIVDDALRPAMVGQGAWAASTSEVFAALYTSAASAWTARGIWTHQITVRDGDPIETAVASLGFGHQQAYGAIRTQAAGHKDAGGARLLARHELRRVLPLVPLISTHQAKSPVFAPRSDRFLRELDASFLNWAATDEVVVFGHVDGDEGDLVGFLAIDTAESVPEIVLAAVAPIARGRGIGGALMQAANAWAAARGIPKLRVDWRTTNPDAQRFWMRAGVVVSARRWSRTIDPEPM